MCYGLSKTEIREKFECKIKLNEALESKELSKKNMEWIIKYLLKNNLFLKKHYQCFKNNNEVKELGENVNYLLSETFFVNDKILMIYIARGLNHIIKTNNMIYNTLHNYLTEKKDDCSDYDNKYDKKLSKRSLINCDDDCWREYLPIKKSEDYYKWSDDGEGLNYSQFDNELDKGLYNYKLNYIELGNISRFVFNDINKTDLLNEIIRYENELDKKRDYDYEYNLERNVFYWIRGFENIWIYLNKKNIFSNELNSGKIFTFMKNGKFDYNIDDDYFRINKIEYMSNHRPLRKKIGVTSTNSFKYLINFDKWINYMRSHDISNLTEMYNDKAFEKIMKKELKEGVKGFLEFRYDNLNEGIDITIQTIGEHYVDIKEKINILNNIEVDNETWSELGAKYIVYDLLNDEIKFQYFKYIKEYEVLIGGKGSNINNIMSKEYLKECINKKL